MIVLRGYQLYRRHAEHYLRRVGAAEQHRHRGYVGRPRHWLWWALVDEWQSAELRLRAAFDVHVPLPRPWDLALSRWVGDRIERRDPGWIDHDEELPGVCDVCEARRRVGRALPAHPACLAALE
ncbi:hypothetical protein, partial [Escherichia coli]|uniref:hypothetical protein n=1 Tax=Escherichia coli TaxID=562 RepID=UPI00191A9C8A